MKVDLDCMYLKYELSDTMTFHLRTRLGELALEYFKRKRYSLDVTEYNIMIFCFEDKVYDNFLKVRSPKYYNDVTRKLPKGFPNYGKTVKIDKVFEIEVRMDRKNYESLLKVSNAIEGYTILGNTLLKYLKEMKYPVAIRKSFDKERFNKDMKEFFQSIGCKLDVE